MDLTGQINRYARKVPNWPLYILCAVPAVWLFWQALNGQLGVNPAESLEHEYGLLALQFLIAGLCVTPLRRYLGLNLIKFRRMIGLMGFFYVTLHLTVWMVLDAQALDQIWADILKRPYITVGMAGFVLLVPLALTSNAWSIRKLGPRWRTLHKLTYGAALLGGLHFVMLRKGVQIEPLVYLGLVAALLALRIDTRKGFAAPLRQKLASR